MSTPPDADPDDRLDGAPIPVVTAVRLTGAAHREELPLLVLGPAEGSAAVELWAETAAGLADAFDVLAWDLPGHGYNAPAPPGSPPLTVAPLAVGVVGVVDDVLAQRGDLGRPCAWAGVGIGAEVALHLESEEPDRVTRAVALDDVPPAAWASRLRRDLLGEDPDAPPPPVLDEHSRALVRLAVAAATRHPGTDGADVTGAARAAGLDTAQVEAVLAVVEEMR